MSDQTRVLLWAVPRSCSSVLLRSLSNIPDSQILFELYTSAAGIVDTNRLGGPTVSTEPTYEGIELDGNGLLKGPGSGFKSSICSFEWVKQQLEADYQSKKVIIAKELAHFFNRRYKLIPTGYQHVFLIRNPYKVFPSWKKLLIEFSELSGRKFELGDPVLDQFPEVTKPGVAYKEITNLWLHIKENNLDTDPIIIDSDDLLQNPKEILSAVCSRVGIPYSDSLLSWEAGVTVVGQWMVSSAFKNLMENTDFYQKTFRNSTWFKKPVPESEIPDLATFSPDVQRCIYNSMPYYLKLFEQRLK